MRQEEKEERKGGKEERKGGGGNLLPTYTSTAGDGKVLLLKIHWDFRVFSIMMTHRKVKMMNEAELNRLPPGMHAYIHN